MDHFWQRRFYDFNVWSARKQSEKLRYMHRNPVTRGLVSAPELWAWSSFRWYPCAEAGVVNVNDWPTSMKHVGTNRRPCPPFEKHEGWGTHIRVTRKGWATRLHDFIQEMLGGNGPRVNR